jgi:hypothetical protein
MLRLKPFQTHSEDFLSFRHDLYEKMGKKPTCRNLSHIGGSKPIFIPSPVPKKNTTIQHGPFRGFIMFHPHPACFLGGSMVARLHLVFHVGQPLLHLRRVEAVPNGCNSIYG